MKKLFYRTYLLEFTISFLQNSLVFIIKPVTFPFLEGVHRLRIELPVVYRHIRINGCHHFDAHKTAAAAGVRQQVFVIARPDERSIAAHLLDTASVRLAQVGDRLLQQVLQESLLAGVYLVEFVNVDQQEAA